MDKTRSVWTSEVKNSSFCLPLSVFYFLFILQFTLTHYFHFYFLTFHSMTKYLPLHSKTFLFVKWSLHVSPSFDTLLDPSKREMGPSPSCYLFYCTSRNNFSSFHHVLLLTPTLYSSLFLIPRSSKMIGRSKMVFFITILLTLI